MCVCADWYITHSFMKANQQFVLYLGEEGPERGMGWEDRVKTEEAVGGGGYGSEYLLQHTFCGIKQIINVLYVLYSTNCIL